jgi:hypothetical protein
MCLIECISLMEERAKTLAPEPLISLGLDRVFSLGLDRAQYFLGLRFNS